jgi:hypothetical protein
MKGKHVVSTDVSPTDRDLAEPSPSSDWRDVYRILGVHPDRFAAMTRMDRPARYRRKHRRGVTS